MTTPRSVTVTESGIHLRQRIEAGRHVFVSDESREAGGGDAGPDPYALLLAALGACTSMTLRLYADRKGWPLEGVSVKLDHERIYEKDCAECETADKRVSRIRRVVTLSGPLSDEQRARLREIAERCPVHRTLVGPVRIETTLEKVDR